MTFPVKPNMGSPRFCYTNGIPVETGDLIVVIDRRGLVAEIFCPLTERAKAFSCFETGGVLLQFDDGDVQVWPRVNEDLVLVKKNSTDAIRSLQSPQ